MDALDLLDDMDTIHTLFNDIPCAAEPNVEPVPVARIQYTPDFAYVMGLYRSMVEHRLDPQFLHTPRLLLLLAVVLRKCPAHYSAWKMRRDIVLDGTKMMSCTRENLQLLLPQPVHCWEDHLSKTQTPCDPVNLLLKTYPTLSEAEQLLVDCWLPSRGDIFAQSSEASGGGASLWKSALWELRVTLPFSTTNPKNFQVWHHRKEVLHRALASTPPEALLSKGSFEEYLQAALFGTTGTSSNPFDWIDERELCDQIFQDDSKNYHLWSHRCWFLSAIPFLLMPYAFSHYTNLKLDDLRGNNERLSLVLRQSVDPAQLSTDTFGFVLPPEHRQLPSLLWQEWEYTTMHISADWFNNSAWCHRHMLLRTRLIEPLVDSFVNSDCGDLEWMSELLRLQCWREMEYALQWAIVEPCNECPFVYARGVADIYQDQFVTLHRRSKPGSSRLDDDVVLESFELHRSLCKALSDVVQPHLEARQNDTAMWEKRTHFIRRNTHQAQAGEFHTLFHILRELWVESLSFETRARLHIQLPPSRCSPIDADYRADDWSVLENFFISSERRALDLVKSLYQLDGIRSKYWKNEAHLVLHRLY